MKKPLLCAIASAAVIGLAPFTAGAAERAGSKATTPAKSKPIPARTVQNDHSPRGDTAVHGFFQAWGNGMQRGARAIGLDKDPLAGRLPGGNSASQRAAQGPFDTDTTR